MAVSEGSTVYLHFKCKSNTVIHPFLDDQLMCCFYRVYASCFWLTSMEWERGGS